MEILLKLNKNMEKNIRKYFLFLFTIFFLLLLLVFLIGNNELYLLINQGLVSPALDFLVLEILMPIFFLLGLIPLFMLAFKNYRFVALFSLFSGPFCYITGRFIKLIFKSPRPFTFLSARIIGPWHASVLSFPSTTTMLAFGLTLPFLVEKELKWSSFFLSLASLVGFSVIYTGFHLPGDVLAGIFFSTLIVFLLNKIKNLCLKWFLFL